MALLDLPAPLVLASTSKYRRAQLERLGLPFSCVAPPYAEEPVPGLDARQLVDHHARQKALAVQQLPAHASAWVLGADQGVVLDEPAGAVLLGKPGSFDAAVQQLLRLAGRDHELRTAVVLALPQGPLLERVVTVRMRVRTLTRAEAEAYVARDQPLDCAGSYRIEAAGPLVLEAASGDDPTAIEGLPLLAVAALLREGLALTRGGLAHQWSTGAPPPESRRGDRLEGLVDPLGDGAE